MFWPGDNKIGWCTLVLSRLAALFAAGNAMCLLCQHDSRALGSGVRSHRRALYFGNLDRINGPERNV